MPGHFSAPDALSPAFARTKRMLFQPFRFGLWSRLAVVALLTGEAGGGGGSAPNFSGIRGSGGDKWRAAAHFFANPDWQQIQPYLGWIIAGFVALIAVVLLWVYSDCVFRFILLDAVITGQCRLREGWKKWRDNGRDYFVWVLAFGFCSLLLIGIVAGIPIWLAWRAGWLQKGEDHLGALIGGGLLLGLVILLVIVALAIVDLFARDFLIPVMALEDVDAVEGWNRLLAMMGMDKGAYALYVIMKVVLAMGAAIAFTIINVIVILVLLIPLGIIALIGYAAGQGLGVNWDNISVDLILVALALLAFAGLMYVVGFVYTPGLVFFESFTLEFFAARYGPLRMKMFPIPSPGSAPPAPLVAPPTSMIPPLLPGDAFPV